MKAPPIEPLSLRRRGKGEYSFVSTIARDIAQARFPHTKYPRIFVIWKDLAVKNYSSDWWIMSPENERLGTASTLRDTKRFLGNYLCDIGWLR